ncbi:hypothetical protein DAI22_06g053000 [Oryza sativa Japonica Group]|nr:hypothetical protein DAI22_06g053000 [Oryza sativa Japonica Group]
MLPSADEEGEKPKDGKKRQGRLLAAELVAVPRSGSPSSSPSPASAPSTLSPSPAPVPPTSSLSPAPRRRPRRRPRALLRVAEFVAVLRSRAVEMRSRTSSPSLRSAPRRIRRRATAGGGGAGEPSRRCSPPRPRRQPEVEGLARSRATAAELVAVSRPALPPASPSSSPSFAEGEESRRRRREEGSRRRRREKG